MRSEIPVQKLPGKKRFPNKIFDIEQWGQYSGSYDSSRPHRHNYFEILLFFKGGGLHEIDFKQYPIKNNSIHFVPSHSVHLLRRGPQSDGATILFEEEIFYGDENLSQYFKNLSLYKCTKGHVLSFNRQEFNQFEILYKQMNEEIKINSRDFPIVIKSLLALFLSKAERQFDLLPSISSNKINRNIMVEKYRFLIDKNFLNHKHVQVYAQELHVTPKHLNELCKQHAGITAQKMIHERLLLEIKRLLVHTDISIKEVCYQSGFDDPAHFNHFFRFHMKLTPLQYRNSTR